MLNLEGLWMFFGFEDLVLLFRMRFVGVLFLVADPESVFG